jgi:cell division protease FtsH
MSEKDRLFMQDLHHVLPPGIGARCPSTPTVLLFALSTFISLSVYVPPSTTSPNGGVPITLSYSAFRAQVRANRIATVYVSGAAAHGAFAKPYAPPGTSTSYRTYDTTLLSVPDPTLMPLLEQHGVQVMGEAPAPPAGATLFNVLGVLGTALPWLVLLILAIVWRRSWTTRGNLPARQRDPQMMSQSSARLYSKEQPRTTFGDVAGADSAKQELAEEVDILRHPLSYQRLGARTPKGVLLVGPPGTGKTLLARAVAGEAHVPFFSISGSAFVEVFVGIGASRVRDLFERAAAAAPAIIFIDEIDAIGRQRSGTHHAGGNDEREQTLNQLLVCMDGFDSAQNVIVLAATNRPDVLDPALLRPGRFDRQVMVDLPDRRGRELILRIHTRAMPLAPDVDLAALAQATPGMSGADLANLANEAAMVAARTNAAQVSGVSFAEALDRITLGAPGAALLNEDERNTVSYHEAGHALVALLLPQADPVMRITITPRGRSLGITQFRPIDERRTYRRDYLRTRLAVGLGGRAAEEIACEEITSGAQNDLQEVTRLARMMVTHLGMVDAVGPAYLGGSGDDALEGNPFAPWAPQAYSDETARHIDAAMKQLIADAYETARTLLCENRSTLDAIAAALLREESLDRDQLAAIVGTADRKVEGHIVRGTSSLQWPKSAAAHVQITTSKYEDFA